MKRLAVFALAFVALLSCQRVEEVPFVELHHYFFNHGLELPADPKIDSAEEFAELFGMAAVMGTDGQPTSVDFEKEFVIAVVCPVTDLLTELAPESLRKADGKLVFTYSEKIGEKQTWSMQPVLLVKVDRQYECPVELERIVQ